MTKRLAALLVVLALTAAGGGYFYYARVDVVGKISKLLERSPQKVEVEAPEPKKPFPKTAVRFSGRIVHVMSGIGVRGTGAVIGPYLIITAAHVIKNQDVVLVDVGIDDYNWKGARVVAFLKASTEDIVLLQLLGDEPIEGNYFRMKTGNRTPRYVVTHRGVFNWQPGIVTPGDSGCPILNANGDVIGVVHGHYTMSRKNIPALFKRVKWVNPYKVRVHVKPKPKAKPKKPKPKKRKPKKKSFR